MKTLIFNGSPRKHGDTVALLDALCRDLSGEVKIVDAYFCNVNPCTDCRFCWVHPGCAIADEMQDIYAFIESCDNIVIASPIYFSELTGPLLSVFSRLQTYWCAKTFRKETPIRKKKLGGMILTGGGDGSPKKAESTAACLLHQMNAEVAGTVFSLRTNTLPAAQDDTALAQVKSLAQRFNAALLER